jgi:AcrR family transcriptional regulator
MSPRTQKQFKVIREEKKTLIMDVALEHFAKEGYFNTSISHIAKHAGISKGLLYNYFVSKEELLSEIVKRSMEEISRSFNTDKNGILSGEEFEQFVRNYFRILRENLSFWRLFYQLMLQKDVRDHFLKSYPGPVNSVESIYKNGGNTFLSMASRMINDYFERKKEKMPAGFDAILDMNMFIYTIEGFARLTVFLDEIDSITYEKSVNRIIEVYK